MNHPAEMCRQASNPSTRIYFSWMMVICAVILFLIWPVKHTIVLRSFLLLSGGMIGLGYMIREYSCLFQKSALPLLFLFLFFAWLITQYFLFSHNPQQEFAQIQGTWLRALLACFLGVGSGLFARHHRGAQLAIYVGILSFLVISYFDYACVSLENNDWSFHYHSDLGLFGYKNTAVFYGTTLLAAACGVITFELRQAKRAHGYLLFASIVSIGLVFLMFVIVGTKNGVVIGLMFFLCIFVSFFARSGKSFASISIASMLIFFVCSISYLHLRLTPEWTNIYPSIKAGLQTEKYPNWKNHTVYGVPKLGDGTSISESAYLRTAWLIEGLKLSQENPLGYGLYDRSFRYLADERSVLPPQSPIIATHCGWLDFALGLGVPGLLLMWSAIALAFVYSFKQKSLWSSVTRWVLVGILITWLLDEVCNNHYIETLFYLVALLSAGNIPVIAKNPHLVSDMP